MAMAIPAAEVAESAGAGAIGKAGASKAASGKAASSKASANPTKMAGETNAKISSGEGTPKSKANPTGDPLALSEQLPEKKKSSNPEAEQRARNRESRAQESHSNRQADRSAKLNTPEVKTKGKGAKKVVGWAFSGNRKLLTAEFIACLIVLGLGTLLAPEGSKDGMPRAMVKGSALSALFLVLALVASGGKSPAKVATALGTLVTASYVLTSSDVHNVVSWVSSFFSKTGDVSAKNPTGSDTSVAPETPNAPGTPTGAGEGPGTGINPAPAGDFESGDQWEKGSA